MINIIYLAYVIIVAFDIINIIIIICHIVGILLVIITKEV